MFNWIKKLGSRHGNDGNFFFEIKSITGFKPRDPEIYKLALRHSSATREDNGLKLNNQRLEYLGDAILGAVVAEFLYDKYKENDEGFLTNMRSKIVSRRHLNQLGIQLGLHKMVIKKTPRAGNSKSIYGDALEALIGAVYLDRGFGPCKSFILDKLLLGEIDIEAITKRIASHKSALLEWSQKYKKKVSFEMTGSWGESHAKKYEVSLLVNDKLISKGTGSSKKKAEEEASRIAYKKLAKANE